MKRYLMLASFAFLLSCGGSSDVTNQNNNENLNSNNTVVGPEIDFQILKSYMTFDVLGGVFRKNSTSVSAETIESDEGSSIGKSVQNLPGATATQSEPFEIDYSNQYVGANGRGRLVVSVLGSGTESGDLRHFNILTLRFLFFDYLFKNPCVGDVSLDGELHCEVTGDYRLDKKEFLGEAHCINGPKTDPMSLLYITPQKAHEISVDTTISINGNFYKYKNYSYTGKITIDGEALTIEDLVGRGGSCS